MNKELTPLEAFYDLLSPIGLKEEGLKRYNLIETTLKNYQELVEKPCVLAGRTHGQTKALIDTICKNYKEIKITNLEDEKKIKALETLKEILHTKIHIDEEENVAILYADVVKDFKTKEFTHLILGYVYEKEKCDLLKEVFL